MEHAVLELVTPFARCMRSVTAVRSQLALWGRLASCCRKVVPAGAVVAAAGADVTSVADIAPRSWLNALDRRACVIENATHLGVVIVALTLLIVILVMSGGMTIELHDGIERAALLDGEFNALSGRFTEAGTTSKATQQ